MKKSILFYILTILGVALITSGMIILKTVFEPEGVMVALPYIMIGLGCGTFGHSAGNLVNRSVMKKNPELAKQDEINKNDERNVIIANCSKAKAYDAMVFIFGALMISFALMNVELLVVLLLVFSYLLVVGIGIFYRLKYDKEM